MLGEDLLISSQGTLLAVTAYSVTHLYIGLSDPDETSLLLLLYYTLLERNKYVRTILIFWIPTIAFKNSLFPGKERTKQLSVQHALCDHLISENKPFEHCSIISFAKVDTTVSTHSTNIRSAVQKGCCRCTFTALYSAEFHFASLCCPPWPLQFRPSWFA